MKIQKNRVKKLKFIALNARQPLLQHNLTPVCNILLDISLVGFSYHKKIRLTVK